MPHILLIEDDDILRQTIAQALNKRGFHVTGLSEYMQSEDYINITLQKPLVSNNYIAAIIDLKLHNQLSLPLIPLLRARIPHIKILVLTGYASIATAVEAVKLGADNYLPKPASLDSILTALTLNKTPHAAGENMLNKKPAQTTIISTQRLEWEHIQRVLLRNEGNISAAARDLNMHRRTLQRKLQKYPYKE